MSPQEFIDTDLEPVTRSPEKTTATSSSLKSIPVPNSGMQNRAEIDNRVEQARQQMLELRRQQEELERERQELEDLRRRQEEFEAGKIEMLEELSRTVAMIEQEEFEINKRSTLLTNSREAFQGYVRQLEAIREVEWSGDELKSQLVKAFSVVESARAELNRGRAQLSFLGEGLVKLNQEPSRSQEVSNIVATQEAFDFKQEFLRGFARSLPLIILGILALIILSSKHS